MISPSVRSKSWAIPKFDIKDPSLQLYLPLWYPDSETTGTTIISKDIYRRSCTVTEATWGNQGRTFDGVNDNISLGNVAALNFSTGDFSIGAWIKSVGTWAQYKQLIGKKTTGAGYGLYTLAGGEIYFSVRGANDAGVTDMADAAVTLTNSVFAQCWWVVTRSGTTLTLKTYQDGVLLGTEVDTVDGSLANAINFLLLSGADTTIPITIGEIYGCSRALSAGEIQNSYQVTKWRF